jgi:hypothetical protein
MIDLLALITIVLIAPPSLCEQQTAFVSVPPLHIHYVWKNEHDSGITPFFSCVPPNASYIKRVIDI